MSHSNEIARKFQTSGAFVLRYSLVFFLLFFGALKWTSAETLSVEPLIRHSPLLFWLPEIFGTQGGSEFIGVIEIAIGILIASWHWSPRLSALRSLLAVPMFLVTLSFLVTTPGVGDDAPFLLKDLCLLGAALWTAGEALQANEQQSGKEARAYGDAAS